MQEFRSPSGTLSQEFYKKLRGETEPQFVERMEKRAADYAETGSTLVRRVRIGRNDPCPCRSGRKFKKCCINKVNVS